MGRIALRFQEDWFRQCGRLEEPGEGEASRLFTGRLARMRAAAYAMPLYQSSRPLSPAGGNTFYLSHTVIRRRRRGPGPRVPDTSEAPADRVFVFPTRAMGPAEREIRQRRLDRAAGTASTKPLPTSMTGQLRAMGGIYDRVRRCWHVGKEMVERRVVPPSWRGRKAVAEWFESRVGRPDNSSGTASRFQAYIERAKAGDAARRAAIESDAEGEISFGTIGRSSEERIRFWDEAEDGERPGGRVQQRVIAELPHWVAPSDRRRIAERFVEVFKRLDLPFHAVVHLPDVAEGGDERNVHLHVVYHDRPARPRPDGRPALKRPEVAHISWVGGLRRHFAGVVNEVIAEAAARGVMPPEGRGFYDPRTYAEMGIPKDGAQHMGAWRMRLERTGVPTLRGVMNGWKEGVWRAQAASRREDNDVRRLGQIAERIYDRGGAATSGPAGDLDDRLSHRLEDQSMWRRIEAAFAEVQRDFVVGRALRRVEWAQEKERRLRERLPEREPARPVRGRGTSQGSTTVELVRRYRDVGAEARLIAERYTPLPVQEEAPSRAHGKAIGLQPETAAATAAVLDAIVRGRDRRSRLVDELEADTAAFELSVLLERLMQCRQAAESLRLRSRSRDFPKPPLGPEDRLSSADLVLLVDWRRNLSARQQVAEEAKTEAVRGLVRLDEAVRDAEAHLCRPLLGQASASRPAAERAAPAQEDRNRQRLVQLLRLCGRELTWSSEGPRGPIRPVLSRIVQLEREILSGKLTSASIDVPRSAARASFAGKAGASLSEPGDTSSGRPHPLRIKRERQRTDTPMSKTDPVLGAIVKAIDATLPALERWICVHEVADLYARNGPLKGATAEEAAAWDRRQAVLAYETSRIAAAIFESGALPDDRYGVFQHRTREAAVQSLRWVAEVANERKARTGAAVLPAAPGAGTRPGPGGSGGRSGDGRTGALSMPERPWSRKRLRPGTTSAGGSRVTAGDPPGGSVPPPPPAVRPDATASPGAPRPQLAIRGSKAGKRDRGPER